MSNSEFKLPVLNDQTADEIIEDLTATKFIESFIRDWYNDNPEEKQETKIQTIAKIFASEVQAIRQLPNILQLGS